MNLITAQGHSLQTTSCSFDAEKWIMLEKDGSLQEGGQWTKEKVEKPEHSDTKERDCIQQDFSVVHSHRLSLSDK